MQRDRLPREEVEAALGRVTGSRIFERAATLSNLLRYVVEKAQAGDAGQIKEYTIAVEVFGRSSYDPQVHSLVRVEIGKLRKRLMEYYETEGAGDPIRIAIPKGGYVPELLKTAVRKRTAPRHRLLIGAAAACLAGLVTWFVVPAGRVSPRPAGSLSMAVLPFTDLSPTKESEGLCDGLTEELITRLAGVEGLQVAARTSVLQYKDRRLDVRRIGQELNVRTILEGSVRVEGGRIRVIAQLIDSADGFHLWTSTVDRELANVHDIQPDIVSAIFDSFQVELKTTRRALVRPHSQNREARHYYMGGARLVYMEPSKAVEFYQAAVVSDPGYALAWAGLALALVTAEDWGETSATDVIPRAAEAARQALVLNANLAEAHQASGHVRLIKEYDWAGAEKAFRRAIELDPAHVDARRDFALLVLTPLARFAEAVDQLQRAIALNPTDNNLHNALASAYIKARRYEEAAEAVDASQKISIAAPGAWVYRGMVAYGRGDLEEAIRCFERAGSRRRTPFALGHLGYAYARSGRKDDALGLAAELKQGLLKPARDYELAMVHAGLGDKEEAFAALDRAIANQAAELLWINVDYRAEVLRPDPRFTRILRRLRIPAGGTR